MSTVEKVLKDIVYGSVGAVAATIEAGSSLAKVLVEKGEAAVRQGQERAGELKQAMQKACDDARKEPEIDISCLTRAQRDELRRRLDEMDAAQDAQSRQDGDCECEQPCECDSPCECESSCECEQPCECGSDIRYENAENDKE